MNALPTPLRILLAGAAWAAMLVCPAARAATLGQAQPGAQTEADEKAIREGAAAFTSAFNAADAKAVAALWAVDGEYIDEDGNITRGRAEIEKEYAAFFKAHPKARIQIEIASIRFVSPGVALEEGTSHLIQPPVGHTSSGTYSTVHARQGGKWLMVSVRDVASRLMTNYERLRAMETAIGDWIARDGDVRVETHIDWLEHRNFLRRTFTVFRKDEATSSGTQIIGVDPTTGQVTSWEFDSDGGLARGIWNKDGDRWVVTVSGVTRDGVPSASTNIMTFVSKDTYTWRSTNRSLGGEPLRDLPETKVNRKK